MQVGRAVVYFDADGGQHPAQVAKDWGTGCNLVVFDNETGEPSVKTSVQPFSEESQVNCFQAF